MYHASLNTFFEVITQLNDDYNCVAIFSHNPVINEFVNQLVENVTIENMPTCGVFAVKTSITKWKEFSTSKKEFLFLITQKLAKFNLADWYFLLSNAHS